MTVVTEMTDYGRMMRPVSPEQPMYYIAQAGGFRQLGDTVGGEKSPAVADLERALKKSLADNGYVPVAAEGQRPALVLIYTWGSHNALAPETIADGITYGVDHGAQVINLSMGLVNLKATQSEAKPVCDAVANAVSHNVVIVAAAGNDGDSGSIPIAPATCLRSSSVSSANFSAKKDCVCW